MKPRRRSVPSTRRDQHQDALQAGLDAIGLEDPKGPYANLLAVRTADKDQPWVRPLVRAFQSPEVRRFFESTFAGSMVPAF